MNLAEGPTFTELADRMDKPLWEFDFEVFENTGHAIYFVMCGNTTIATCRVRSDAEQIVRDHNGL